MLVYRTAQDIPAPFDLCVFKEGAVASNAASGAFCVLDTLTFSLRVSRALLCERATLCVFTDDTLAHTEYALSQAHTDLLYTDFSLTLSAQALCGTASDGLFFYTIRLETPYGAQFTSTNRQLYLNETDAKWEQLTVYQKEEPVPAWLSDGIFYQVFVDRFAKGGDYPPKPYTKQNPDWEHGIPEFAPIPGGYVENNEFFGGTLTGVTDKLPYLASLGVTCLYLSPIFDAHSNHKYDTGDYEHVDTMFGGDDALRALLTEAKTLGITVLLDGVFNHTGADSKYFNRDGHYDSVGAYQSQQSPYYPWYTFYRYPDSYRAWWDIPILPAVRTDNADYQSYLLSEQGVIAKWMSYGIGGFRLDVADELDESFLQKLHTRVKACRADAILLGEVWEDASNKIAYDKRRRYFRGGELESVMNYPLRTAIVSYLLTGDVAPLAKTAKELWDHYPRFVSAALMNLLGTHDTERILNILSGVSYQDKSNAELAGFQLSKRERLLACERVKVAYFLLCFLPGNPCIYYGDEAGMEGWCDPFNRRPYPWGHEDTTLLAWYRKLGKLRRSLPFLGEADFSIRIAEHGVFGFTRCNKNGGIFCAVNRTKTAYPVDLGKGEFRDLLHRRHCSRFTEIEPGGMLLVQWNQQKKGKNIRRRMSTESS